MAPQINSSLFSYIFTDFLPKTFTGPLWCLSIKSRLGLCLWIYLFFHQKSHATSLGGHRFNYAFWLEWPKSPYQNVWHNIISHHWISGVCVININAEIWLFFFSLNLCERAHVRHHLTQIICPACCPQASSKMCSDWKVFFFPWRISDNKLFWPPILKHTGLRR